MISEVEVATEDLAPPPSHPPRLLTDEQILQLARQGHLPLKLPDHLASLYAQLDAASTDFFALPSETKRSLYSSEGQATELGFVSIPGEKDYITFRAQSPHNHESELEQLVASVWAQTYILFRRILSDLSYGLNIDHEVWEAIIEDTSPIPATLDVATPTFLRIFRYAADKGIAERHMDMGLLTLCVCQGKGLQVLNRTTDGTESWSEYSEPTLLLGQTLGILTGGLLKPGIHRVVTNTNGRGSIVYALRPNTKREIDLSAFPTRTNAQRGTIHLSELWRSIWSKSYNVNAPRQVREKQKERKRKEDEDVNGGGTNWESKHDITNTRAAFEL